MSLRCVVLWLRCNVFCGVGLRRSVCCGGVCLCCGFVVLSFVVVVVVLCWCWSLCLCWCWCWCSVALRFDVPWCFVLCVCCFVCVVLN